MSSEERGGRGCYSRSSAMSLQENTGTRKIIRHHVALFSARRFPDVMRYEIFIIFSNSIYFIFRLWTYGMDVGSSSIGGFPVFRFASLPVYRFAGFPVYRFTSFLVYWFSSLSVYQFSGLPVYKSVCRFSGLPVYQFSWSKNILIKWPLVTSDWSMDF